MGINYKENNQWKEVKVKVGDNIPVGTIVEFDGQTIPVGWEAYTTGKIKKVSQTVPTSAQVVDGHSNSTTDSYSCNYVNGIVESGSNANGNYIKYVDGTMICTKKITITIPSVSAWGSLYDGNASGGNFALPFIATPIVSVTPLYSAFVEKVVANTTEISTITLARPNNTTNWNVPLDIIAIGKWK